MAKGVKINMEKEEFETKWENIKHIDKTVVLGNGTEIYTDDYGFKKNKKLVLMRGCYGICLCELKNIKKVR